MKMTTLITASLFGLAALGGTAFAGSGTDTSSTTYKARHTQQMSRTDDQQASQSSMGRGTYGAPRQQVLANRDSTQPEAPAAESPQLVIPGSGTAIYSYSPNNPNSHYGY